MRPANGCARGPLPTTLHRMESNGLVKTWMGEATSERGGRAKRMVRVTAKGTQEAAGFYRAIKRISAGASWELN